MQVEIVRNSNFVLLSDIEIGTPFIYEDGFVYVKCYHANLDKQNIIYAMRLSDGFIIEILADIWIPINNTKKHKVVPI